MFKCAVRFLGEVAVCAAHACLTVLRTNNGFHMVMVGRDSLNACCLIDSVIQPNLLTTFQRSIGLAAKNVPTDQPVLSIAFFG